MTSFWMCSGSSRLCFISGVEGRQDVGQVFCCRLIEREGSPVVVLLAKSYCVIAGWMQGGKSRRGIGVQSGFGLRAVH